MYFVFLTSGGQLFDPLRPTKATVSAVVSNELSAHFNFALELSFLRFTEIFYSSSGPTTNLGSVHHKKSLSWW